MNRVILASLFAIALNACGRAPVLELNEFASYVETFEAEAAANGNPLKVQDLIIKFSNKLDSKTEGLCTLGSDTPTIEVNAKTFHKLSDIQKEALLFHELGHCVLGRAHANELANDGTVSSLMNAYLPDKWTLQAKMPELVAELFTKEKINELALNK
ncbi:MAG: putative metallopeptidase [Bacteriovoracia bacterium]